MRGAVPFTARGAPWTMFLGTAAQCALEERHDKGFFAIVQDTIPAVASPADLEDPAKMATAARNLRVGTLRDFALEGLRKHHPSVTIDQVDDIIDDLGMPAFGAIIGAAIAAAADRAAEAEPTSKGKPGNGPTRARGRTGTA